MVAVGAQPYRVPPYRSPAGSMARQLQKAAVRLLSEQTCRRFYPVQISSRMLCAGFPQGGVDSCSVSAQQLNRPPGPHPHNAGPHTSGALPQTDHLWLCGVSTEPRLGGHLWRAGFHPTASSPSQVEG